jgi:hypothetical protein
MYRPGSHLKPPRPALVPVALQGKPMALHLLLGKSRHSAGIVKLIHLAVGTRLKGGKAGSACVLYAAMAVPVMARQVWNRCLIS